MNVYADKAARLYSFRDWKYPFVEPAQLAKAGFYNLRCGDNVRCAFCAIIIGNWQKGDNPTKEHKKWSPSCPLIKEGDFFIETMYAEEKDRLISFKNWGYSFIDPIKLAKDGFYSLGVADYVRCTFCAIIIGNWKNESEPSVRHRQMSPNCPLNGQDVCGIYEFFPNSIPDNYFNIFLKTEDQYCKKVNNKHSCSPCVMERAGMALRRGTNHINSEETDDVQRSIELLDRVLSEFDDVENANQVQNIQHMSTQNRQNNSNTTHLNASSTPEDESPSLGHQSEDDGYMSMNGRKPKFSLAFKPLTEENPLVIQAQIATGDPDDFPPPPEEAEKLISTLLPKVSPIKKNSLNKPREFPLTKFNSRTDTIPPPPNFQNNIINGYLEPKHIATQTTLPKTRHQRPFGWESNDFNLQPPPPPPGFRYGSLPFQHGLYSLSSPTRVPPRTITTAIERHREVRRHGSEDNLSSDLEESILRPLSELADDEHFSDDSLEELLPPPPPSVNQRGSIAWEVSLDSDDALLTPGSTKVVGRRRRKSGSHSSTSSIPNRIKELDEWPDPPPYGTEEEIASPFSDSDDHIQLPSELGSGTLSGSGTYIVRRGKKDRKSLIYGGSSVNSNSSLNSRLSSDLGIPHSRFSVDLNSRLSRELQTPNSRYSIDLSTPHSRLSQELNSPNSRYSLDLNNSRRLSQELISSPSRLSGDLSSSRSSTPQSKYVSDFKKHSSTFDNIKSLIREGVIESYSGPPIESAADFISPSSPLVKVVSLPTLNGEEVPSRRELAVTVEEEEDTESPQQNSNEISPLRKIEQNITELLERRDIEVSSILQDDKCVLQLNGVSPFHERNNKHTPSKSLESRHNEIQRSEDYYRQLLIDGGSVQHYPKRNGIQKSESAKEMLIAHKDKETRPMTSSSSADFPVRVEVIQHDFPPLPPSPVEEDEDEYSEITQSLSQNTRSDTLPHSDPPVVPPHREPVSYSLKTRSMDAGYNRGRRNHFMGSSSRNTQPERRTLPAELQGTKRRTYQKRSSHNAREEHHLQTSCSLPETPIFARGCDIPRTPHRTAPDIPCNASVPRQSNTMSSLNTIGNLSTGGYRRNSGLEQAIVGAELLRLAGGPGRGWYPKQRSARPVSIEHLDRLASGHNPWDSSRKPLTLPPNLTPKFFHRSPRDALRRVTSLLIRKGNCCIENGNNKEPKKDSTLQKCQEPSANGEETQKKKGFFKNLWKKSRHYSLEQQ